jgi:ADP-ribosyl-[dinitrogen reductase] hydrolase
MMRDLEDRARGCLLGLAGGDALGRPVEFKSPAVIEREHGTVTEMLANGSHGQPAGTVTDDTDLALCLAESLVATGGFDPEDIADRFVDWLDAGPFDVGGMTRAAIRELRSGTPPDAAGQSVWESRHEGSNAGNGSVMRCAPYAIAFRQDDAELARISRESSAITHADPRCTYGAAILNCTIAGLLRDESDPLSTALDRVGDDAPAALTSALEPVANGDTAVALRSTGYVVHTLQTALHDALTATCAEQAIVTAVNRGGDADTVGAIAGAVAGARDGATALPDRWTDRIDETARLETLATPLLEIA